MLKIGLSRLLSAVICFVLLLGFVFSFLSLASEVDYSYPASTAKTTVYADDFLEREIGAVLSDAEKKYLELQSGFVLSYNSNIPTSYISVDYSSENNEAEVTASEYSYVAENGTTVVWKPISVSIGSISKDVSEGNYTVKFTGLNGSRVDVKYTAEFTVTKESINRLLNLAYNDAPMLKTQIAEKEKEYVRLHEEYVSNCNKYEAYLDALAEYESLYAVYSEYLSQKRIYDEKYEEYLDYLSDCSDYEDAKEKYDAYLIAKAKYIEDVALYEEYLKYASQHQAMIDEYEEYRQKLNTLRQQLNVIDKTQTPVTELKRTIYSAIMGDTVTSVIANKHLIANELVGVKADTVDRAGVATENLRALLADYFDLQTEEQKYNYYITNYDSFKTNFAELFRTLDKLYENNTVRGELIRQDKQQKYIILLSQLYYISHALSDTRVAKYDSGYYASDYTIFVGYKNGKRVETTPLETIGNQLYIPDYDNAQPLKDGYPASVEKPEFTKMEQPVAPSKVDLPIPPEPVPMPTAPVAVAKPTMPKFVKKPGAEPQPYIVPAEIEAVINEYDNGLVNIRKEYEGEDIKLTPEITVSKEFVNPESVTVIYYDKEFDSNEKQTELYRVTIDKNTYADYLGPVPEKLEDAEYIYTFSGWTDSLGNKPNLNEVSRDLFLYPKFDSEMKEYNVSWIVDGEVFDENPGTPAKEESGNVCYVFTHWEKSVNLVTYDVTYTACFEERYIVPLSNGGADISFVGGNYIVETTSTGSRFDISLLVECAAEKGGIIMKTARGEISFSYGETLELKRAGVHTIEIVVRQRASGGYCYAVNLYKADGTAVSYSAKATVMFTCDITDTTHLVLYYQNDSGKKLTRNTVDDKKITFILNTGKIYYANTEYLLDVIPHAAVKISVDKASAAFNEEVTVIVTAKPGVTVHGVYYIDEDGNKTEITGDKFKMPEKNLSIGADYTIDTYTVSFVSDGKTLGTFKCNYGDTVTPPDDPRKAQDGKYTYTFTGWSPEIKQVTEDVVYTAIYSSTPIVNNNDDGLQITPSVLKIVVLGASVLGILVLAVIPSIVMTLVLVIKRKKHFVKPKKH